MYHFLYYLNSAKKEIMKKNFLGDWGGGAAAPAAPL